MHLRTTFSYELRYCIKELLAFLHEKKYVIDF